MTKSIFQNWKVIAGLSIAAVLLGGAFSFGLFIPKAEAGIMNGGPDGFSLPTSCLAEEVNHWDKIIFKNKKDILNADGMIIPKNSVMDIKVIDDPNQIEFPMKKAVDKLNSVSWTTVDGEDITLKDLKLIDIEYAIVCVGFFDGFPNGDR